MMPNTRRSSGPAAFGDRDWRSERPGWARARPKRTGEHSRRGNARHVQSDFCAFGESEGVLNLNAEIADCCFDFCVSKQDLDSSQIPRLLVHDRRLCPTQRMRARNAPDASRHRSRVYFPSVRASRSRRSCFQNLAQVWVPWPRVSSVALMRTYLPLGSRAAAFSAMP